MPFVIILHKRDSFSRDGLCNDHGGPPFCSFCLSKCLEDFCHIISVDNNGIPVERLNLEGVKVKSITSDDGTVTARVIDTESITDPKTRAYLEGPDGANARLIKVQEALENRTPVITTDSGASGYEHYLNKYVYACENSVEISTLIKGFLNCPESYFDVTKSLTNEYLRWDVPEVDYLPPNMLSDNLPK